MIAKIDLDLLTQFVAVADASSFSEAARQLGVPASKVSRAVQRLEAAVGAQLLHRTTRHVALSTAGAALYERAAPHLQSLRESLGTLPEREDEPSGELRLTAPNDFGAAFVAELVTRFCARYPSVRVDAWLSNRVMDLVAAGFDLALRATARPQKDSSLVARRIATIDFALFASPTYLARRGAPRTMRETESHDWVQFRPGGTTHQPPVHCSARVIADDYGFLREAVRAGAGLGLLPTFLVKDDLEARRLVRVLPRFSEAGGHILLAYPSARHVPRKVTAFRDFLLEALAAQPLGGAT